MKSGAILGVSAAGVSALSTHFKNTRSEKLLELEGEKVSMVNSITHQKAKDGEERRERARVRELATHLKL